MIEMCEHYKASFSDIRNRLDGWESRNVIHKKKLSKLIQSVMVQRLAYLGFTEETRVRLPVAGILFFFLDNFLSKLPAI